MEYIYRVYNSVIDMNISDNYVSIFIYFVLLSHEVSSLIYSMNSMFSLSEKLHDWYIYTGFTTKSVKWIFLTIMSA